MGVVTDIQDGGELHITYTDRQARRIAVVDQLEGSDLDAMLYDAYLAVTTHSEPINIGTAHPSVPGAVCTAIDAYPINKCASARVEILYSVPTYTIPADPEDDGPATKSVRFFGEAKEYTTDPQDSGTDLVVSAPPKYASRPDQIKTVTVNESRAVIVFTRTEPVMPTLRQRTYQNKTNSVALGTGGLWPIGTIYCAVINGDKVGDLAPVVRYEFQYNADGHTVEYKWERPPLDVPEYDANSRKVLEPYGAADFTALGFDWDD